MTVLDAHTAGGRGEVGIDDTGCVVVRPRGQIDVTCAAQFRERLVEANSTGAQTLVIDLSDATFADSYGVVLLLRAAVRARNRGAELVLRSPSTQAWRTLYTTGLIRHFTVDGCA